MILDKTKILKVFQCEELSRYISIFEQPEFDDLKDLYVKTINVVYESNKSFWAEEDKKISEHLVEQSEAYKKNIEDQKSKPFAIWMDGYKIIESKITPCNENKENDYLLEIYNIHSKYIQNIIHVVLTCFATIEGIVKYTNEPENKKFLKENPVYHNFLYPSWIYSIEKLILLITSFCSRDISRNWRINFKDIPKIKEFNSIYSEGFLCETKFEINFYLILELCKKFYNSNPRIENRKIKIEYHGEIHEIEFKHQLVQTTKEVIDNIDKILENHKNTLGMLIKKISDRRHTIAHNVIPKENYDNVSFQELFNVFEFFYILSKILFIGLNENTPTTIYDMSIKESFNFAYRAMKIFKAERQKIDDEYQKQLDNATSAYQVSQIKKPD